MVGHETGGPGKRSFHALHSDFSFPTQTPVKTVLQKYLRKGEFPLFQRVAMFESSFLQVTRKGKHIFFHNHYHEAIIGIASTNTKLPLPNLMFIARPAASQVSSEQYPEEIMLTRLLPLKFVHISIYDSKKQLIKIKLINGRSYYLQLYTSTEEEKDLFKHWLTLVYLLHHPPPCYLQPQPKSCMQLDELSIDVIPSEEEAEHARRHYLKKNNNKKGEQKSPDAAKSQSLDSIAKETYTEYEKLILRTPFAQSEWSLEEVESYRGSSAPVRKPAK
ncbi:Golgi-associated RAB2 interactor protein 6-like [Tiliqua scincoides]|uniref:Golgi-associated RAB2 interactor protein 6-like n=1 Tax=Tiliqua scincoides TaxID=71010 RepID=UPI003462AB22